ncbi:MAG TPA: endolytic transglycosylase MltG [Caulobacteraceae bacterium]|nr:endolytic transglycosylase MltG [Caulobacteraceae bacterium]
MKSPLLGPDGLPRERRLAVMAAGAAMTIVAALVLLIVVSQVIYRTPGPKAANGQVTNVILRPGAGVSEIGSTLARAHVVRSGAVFAAMAELSGAGRKLKAGEYDFPSGASMAKVTQMIRKGQIVHHVVHVPEGLTSEMVVDILMANPFMTGAAPVPEEGSILPETYEFRRGEDRAAVLQRMMDARDKVLGELWAQRKQGLPYASPQEAVILASIVEKETAKDNERPHVASVYLNRLKQGMRLGADPTVIYGISHGRPLGRGITASELSAATPYNTYAIDGLPAGPICNPGRASLAAVLDPAETNDLYFVATGQGGHVFAATEAEHEANVAKWRKVEKSAPAWTAQAGGPAPIAKAKRK